MAITRVPVAVTTTGADYTNYNSAIDAHKTAVAAEEQASNEAAAAEAALAEAQAAYDAAQQNLTNAKAATDTALQNVNNEHNNMRP